LVPDIRSFRKACYEAAHVTGWEVAGFWFSEGMTPNFHQGLVTYRNRTGAVAWVRSSSLLALAEPRDIEFVRGTRDASPLTFVHDPALVTALAEASDSRC
jgi:hypothetical protein